MAEEKKKDDKKGGGEVKMEVEILFWVIVFIVVGAVVIPTLLGFFGVNVTLSDLSTWWSNTIFDAGRAFSAFTSALIFVAVFLSLVFILGAYYAKFRISEINKAQKAAPAKPGEAGGKTEAALTQMSDSTPLSFPANLPGADGQGGAVMPPPENQKWKDIKIRMDSNNQADWRMAILEADIMLDEMLDQMGYEGESIGEKLKRVEPESFTTLNEAWKAHRVRNVIAHEGSSYVLSRSEAERTIRWYEQVFKEFYYI